MIAIFDNITGEMLGQAVVIRAFNSSGSFGLSRYMISLR